MIDLDAVEAVINRPHVIDLRADGWTIMHPPACHPDLFACAMNQAGRDLPGPPAPLGQYICELDAEGDLVIGERASDAEGVDWAGLVAELRAARAVIEAAHAIKDRAVERRANNLYAAARSELRAARVAREELRQLHEALEASDATAASAHRLRRILEGWDQVSA